MYVCFAGPAAAQLMNYYFYLVHKIQTYYNQGRQEHVWGK